MLSIIIVTRNKESALSNCLQIGEKSGVGHELILIENDGKEPISVSYNKGALEAKFEFLCFVHDDVSILTSGWGSLAIQKISTGYDLLGVAGSEYKSKFISGWCSGPEDAIHFHIYHPAPLGPVLWTSGSRYPGIVSKPVVSLDGVWLFCRRSYWERLLFNEEIPGFHFYDLDFSLRSAQIGKNAVVFDIDLLHKSKGTFNDVWLNAAVNFHNNWKDNLPLGMNGMEVSTATESENLYAEWLHLFPFLSRPARKELFNNYEPGLSKKRKLQAWFQLKTGILF